LLFDILSTGVADGVTVRADGTLIRDVVHALADFIVTFFCDLRLQLGDHLGHYLGHHLRRHVSLCLCGQLRHWS